jgi:hypothetical protein
MSDKLPALHFYVQDYLADTRFLSNESKGFYVDLLCYMHKSSRRGYLNQANGQPYSPEDLGMMTGTSADRAAHLLLGLINSEVISATHQGIPFSRRMVRDEKKRQDGIKFGKKGGNPNLKGRVKGGGYPDSEDENEEDLDPPGGDARGGEKRKHKFQKSKFYPFDNFRAALSDWSDAKCRHYFVRAEGYSDANGGRYLNWVKAVRNWDREKPYVDPKGRSAPIPDDGYVLDAFQEDEG